MQTYEVTDAANHNRGGVTAEGDILVSGQQGFAWVTADGTQRDPHTGTSTDAVNCAALDTEGNVWLASSNEGLICYSSGCFASPNLAAGLTDMDINAVTAAGGRYYAAVNQGLLAFDSDWHPVQNALTRALDGVPVQSLMVDSRGRLWCGTYSELGLVRYDTGSGEIVFFNQSNGLGSTRIRVDDRTYESPERLTLGSDARRMTIRFSALTYSGATDLCIGYQLVGFAKAKAYTVGSWLEVWMENYAKVKLRPSTFKTSQGFLKNHIKPQIGSIPLAELTSLDLQRFYKHLLDGGRVDRIEAKKKPKGLAPKTVRNIHQMIGSAYNLAMPRIARRITKGLFSTVENSPFETPRERKGLPPLDPRTAHIKSSSQQPCV